MNDEMTIDDLDLDYEDDSDEGSSSQNDLFESNEDSVFSPQNSEENNQDTGESVLEAYLRYSGIKDPTHIEFQDFQGNSITRHWNDLTPEEQLAILTQSQKDPDTDLNSEEIALINDIRSRRVSPSQYVNLIQAYSRAQAQSLQAPTKVDFDSMSDDLIYLIDLTSKADLSDEEATELLENAKSNPALFEKLVAGIRQLIKDKESSLQQEYEARVELDRADFQDSILDSIENFTSVGSVELDMLNDEMNDLASYILPLEGVSGFGADLNDPRNIVKAAWFLKFGDRMLEDIQNHTNKLIQQARQEGYQLGAALRNPLSTGNVVIKPQTTSTAAPKPRSIDDLNY